VKQNVLPRIRLARVNAKIPAMNSHARPKGRKNEYFSLTRISVKIAKIRESIAIHPRNRFLNFWYILKIIGVIK
jgi:hypothetical protein